MAGLTLDRGTLIAFEKHDRRVMRILKGAATKDLRLTIPAGVLAQVWRRNNPRIAALLKASVVESMTGMIAKNVGNVLAASSTSDIVDGAVVEGALRRGDAIVTSDPEDISGLLSALHQTTPVLKV